MKVVVVAGFAPSLVNFRGPLVQALVAAGCDVVATASEADETVRSRLESWGIRYISIPLSRAGLNPICDLRYRFALRKLFREEMPDVVLAYTHKPVINSAFAAAPLPCPPRVYPLITGLGFAFLDGGGWKQALARRVLISFYRRASRHFTGVFFQNPDDEALFRRLRLIPATTRSLVVRGSGIELSGFPFSPLPVEYTCGASRFLLIARLLSDKGIREYVEAARRLKLEYPLAEWHIVGPFDPNPAAISHSEVNAWEMEGVIQFHGAQSDVRPALRECSVYVLPSYREGTPRTVLEAMATGRAVITTDAPGCRETVFGVQPPDHMDVREGENGYLVPAKSVDPLIAAMRRFLESSEVARAKGLAGRRLAEEYYDARKVNRTMLEFMELTRRR